MKRLSIVLLVLVLLFVIGACGQKEESAVPEATPEKTETAEEPANEEKEFTLEELAEFNGKDGNKAYIAVDGIVYDVTDVPPWKGGDHNGYEAGKDLTEEIKTKSPHGVGKLEGVPVVGKLTK